MIREPAVRNRQIEVAECGLAALAMAASMVGSKVDLASLRQQYPISARGLNLGDICQIASAIGFSTRTVRCELAELSELKRPSILHWGMNHFVVLDKVTRRQVRIFDPAKGYRTLLVDEVSRKFTGVAIELAVTPAFERRSERSPLKLSSLFRWEPEVQRGLFQALLLSIVMQSYVIGAPFYMRLAVDEAAMKGDVDLITTLAVGFAIFAAFNAGAEILRNLVIVRLSSALSISMSQRLFRHMLRLPLPWFQRRRLADVQSRFQALDPIKNLMANGLIAVLIDGVMSLCTAVLMFAFARDLAAITTCGLIIYIIIRSCSLSISLRCASDALEASIAEQGKRLDALRAVQTIKVMGGELKTESDWSNKLVDSIKTGQINSLIGMTFSTTHQLIDTIVNIIIVLIGVRSVMDGTMTVGILYAFLAYRGQFMSRSVGIFEQIVAWRLLDVHALRLADVVLTTVEPNIDRVATGLPTVHGGIEMDRVSFRYGAHDRMILNNVSLSVKPGEFVAIVGPSGAGKSTLLKIICGLYPPTGGEVRLDGLPLSVWGAKAVRQALGAVMQNDDLLSGSIMDNVAFFDEQIDIERVWECLRMASIDEEVRRMPMRAETVVGDMGSTLSGGQKQRLLLARALYKQPKFLILDEATSHVDLVGEKAINAELSALKITRIVVAHRPETIAAADRVLHLTDKLVELTKVKTPLV